MARHVALPYESTGDAPGTSQFGQLLPGGLVRFGALRFSDRLSMHSEEQTNSSGASPVPPSPPEPDPQFSIVRGPDRWARIAARLDCVPRLVNAVLSQLASSSPRRFYGVRLHGTGIRCPSEGRPINGFYTTQMPLARSENDAIAAARRVVMNRWQTDPMYVSWNKGELPRLEVDETFLPEFWTAVFFMGKGHMFYAEDPASDI